MISMRVLFPDTLGPMMAKKSPRIMERLTSTKTLFVLKLKDTPSTVTRGCSLLTGESMSQVL